MTKDFNCYIGFVIHAENEADALAQVEVLCENPIINATLGDSGHVVWATPDYIFEDEEPCDLGDEDEDL